MPFPEPGGPKIMNLILCFTLSFSLLVGCQSHFDVPEYIAFQEKLKNPAGKFDVAPGSEEEESRIGRDISVFFDLHSTLPFDDCEARNTFK